MLCFALRQQPRTYTHSLSFPRKKYILLWLHYFWSREEQEGLSSITCNNDRYGNNTAKNCGQCSGDVICITRFYKINAGEPMLYLLSSH